ncbi:hypothetical protein D917_05661 [Trichinella nativa]|uniref:Uncharacterized protein n=1 Tax=Trichinella nativa TaxID=6335 RepID=A0A1Y3F1G6_9BILA|nr:hypothetical protein D917_05661 [Trichinella nativa]
MHGFNRWCVGSIRLFVFSHSTFAVIFEYQYKQKQTPMNNKQEERERRIARIVRAKQLANQHATRLREQFYEEVERQLEKFQRRVEKRIKREKSAELERLHEQLERCVCLVGKSHLNAAVEICRRRRRSVEKEKLSHGHQASSSFQK